MAGVVLVHVNIYTGTPPSAWWPFGAWSCLGFAVLVPAFFTISGFVLSLGNPPGVPLDARRFARRRLVPLALSFLVWNAVMLGVGIVLKKPISLGEAVLCLFTGYWHLYFVCALLQLLVLFVLL